MGRIKGERNERHGDWAEKHNQNLPNVCRFDIESIRFFFKNALGRSSKLCFLCRRGGHFQKNRETKLPESEKWSQNTLDGKYDGYMRRLGGTKKRKC